MKKLPKLEYEEVDYKIMSDDLKHIIGHLCDRWSHLEIDVDRAIFKLAKVENDVGYIMLGKTQVKGKLSILTNLEGFLGTLKDRPKTLKFVLGQFDHVAYSRNCVVHGRYLGTIKGTENHFFFTPMNQYHDDEGVSGSKSFYASEKELKGLCDNVELTRKEIREHYLEPKP